MVQYLQWLVVTVRRRCADHTNYKAHTGHRFGTSCEKMTRWLPGEKKYDTPAGTVLLCSNDAVVSMHKYKIQNSFFSHQLDFVVAHFPERRPVSVPG